MSDAAASRHRSAMSPATSSLTGTRSRRWSRIHAGQLRRAGTPAPQAIGIDEIAVGKGHSYRIVVSDLVRKRPIWFGGTDRSEASMAAFYNWLGRQEEPQNQARRDGHVEAVPHRCASASSASGDPVRQVPRHAPPGRGARCRAQERICPALRQGPPLHQGPEVHAALAPGEPARSKAARP